MPPPPPPPWSIVSPEQAAARRAWLAGQWTVGGGESVAVADAKSPGAEWVAWHDANGKPHSINCAAYPPIFKWPDGSGVLQWMDVKASDDSTLVWLTTAEDPASQRIVWQRAGAAGLSKAEAFAGKVGKVQVKLDRPYFVVGEKVEGTVFVENAYRLPVDKVYVKAKGKERVSWEEHWVEEGSGKRKHKKYASKDEFFKLKVRLPPPQVVVDAVEAAEKKASFLSKAWNKLEDVTGVDLDFDGDVGVAGKGARDLPPGKHAFPFSFNLPTHSRKGQPLAGSFKYKDGHAGWSGSREIRKLKAKIECDHHPLARPLAPRRLRLPSHPHPRLFVPVLTVAAPTAYGRYSLKVCVDLNDEKDLEKKIDITVFEQPPSSISQAVSDTVSTRCRLRERAGCVLTPGACVQVTQPVMLCCW